MQFKMNRSVTHTAWVLFFYLNFSFTPADAGEKGVSPPPLPTPSPSVKPNAADLSPELIQLERLVGEDSFRRVVSKTDDVGSRIPSIIFNAISHWGFTMYGTPQFNLNLKFGRDVYDNKSVLGTWTVVDQVGVDGAVPFFNSSVLLPGIANGFNFYIGSDAGVVVTDIRQVNSKQYSKIPSIGVRANKILKGEGYQNLLKTKQLGLKEGIDQLEGKWVQFTNEVGEKLISFLPADSESHARYAKIWNMFLTPFRLPLTASRVAKMEQDEIISYEGQGALQSGLGTGWNIDPTGLTSAISAGISVSAFSRGTFRISILKESDTIVRVKVSKIGTLGHQWSAGSGYMPGFLDHVVILRSLTGFIRILPFQLSRETDHSRTFEVTYQFDLSTQAGAQAYETAVIGNLQTADELAITPHGQWRTSLAETGVLRLTDYQSKSQTTTASKAMQLTFLFRQNQVGQVIDTEGVLVSPDGTKRTLTALAQNTQEWGIIFNQFQKYQHNFVVNLDLDLCEREPQACQKFPMQIEGRIDDSDTTQSALLHYILEVENSVGQPQLFPRTPEIRDLRNFTRDPYQPFYFYHRGHDLGSSHFYYALNLNAEQVQEFIDFPQEKMWGALERAFHVREGVWSSERNRWAYGISRAPVSFADLFLNLFQLNWAPGTDLFHAERAISRWLNLRAISHPIKKAEALAKTFMDTLYSKNMVNLVRTVLAERDVDYYASGSSRVFGNVSKQGGTHLAFEDLASDLAKSVELKRKPTPEELDPELQVNGLRVDGVSASQLSLDLSTPISPDSYYVDLTINDWSSFLIKNKLIFAKVFKNPGQPAGESKLALDPNDLTSPWSELARHIRPNIRYLLRVATSKDGQKWGPVGQTQFRVLR